MMRTRLANELASFSPGYFALVMATGIVSLAVHLQSRTRLALGLFGLNLLAYSALWAVSLARVACFPRRVLEDLTHHSRGAAFLTTAAATCVLGSQFALLTPWMGVARGLWIGGAALCAVLSYTFLTAIIACEPKPSLEAGISGLWLLTVVAIESISALGALIARAGEAVEAVLFISLATYLVGAMLYGLFATLILYRWLFFRLRPEKFTPDYWIDMGALAITTLASALLLQDTRLWPWLEPLAPFLTGLTVGFWAAASWWIPLLLLVELWRHFRRHVPFHYGPDYWALVFPLGMYAVANFTVAQVTGLSFLKGLGEGFTYVALLAWVSVFVGLLHRLAHLAARQRAPREQPSAT